MTSLKAQADRVERLMEQARRADYPRSEELRRTALAIVNGLDTHRMLTNTPTAHREWERAAYALHS